MGALIDLLQGIGAKAEADALAIDAYIEELCSHEVEVGYHSDGASYDDGASVLDVAAWNEYGTENAPARPFMRQTLEDYEDQIISRGQSQFKKGLNGDKNAQTTFNAMGTYVKGCIQKEIRDGEFEPNAPSTIAKKGSDKPLIDTGRMRQSVTYVIK